MTGCPSPRGATRRSGPATGKLANSANALCPSTSAKAIDGGRIATLSNESTTAMDEFPFSSPAIRWLIHRQAMDEVAISQDSQSYMSRARHDVAAHHDADLSR